jgi:Protein of unknown function (DUF3489)
MSKSKLNSIEKTCEGFKPGATNIKPTKADTILKLLKSGKGASLEDLRKATGWQAHSVRGFLSGTVKKRMGLAVVSGADKSGIRRYRIASETASARG